MKFSIAINRGNILDVINLAEENNLIINSISQEPINDEMMNIKIDFSANSKVIDIDNFVKIISGYDFLSSCERI
ncbi:hypothetical protein GCM10008904_07630 [Paraclostridium ghonii]|uniref:ACT domain-containing protein n=1 Tax=Paraclostridium ghonii TaxID=29358 RepID=A0ABU0N4W8_9FIRM|nr:hypothetical protein [Paeniclostridium ghonii]MDQ0558192.1 ACT domain-containing protein [Paeniclostridium ghonii]